MMLQNKKRYKTKRIRNEKKIVKLEKNYSQKFKLKSKIVNHQLKNGNKRTCENALLQSLKFFQRVSTKNYKHIILLAIINATPIFLLKNIKQLKRRKRRERLIPFIPKEEFRISYSIKNLIKEALKKSVAIKSYKSLAQEMLSGGHKKSEALNKKNEIQEQALKSQKQLSRFRWF